MPGNHHQPRKLSHFDNLLLACDKAAFFLTPIRQPYAHFNGTVALLYSEQFRGWLLTRILARFLAMQGIDCQHVLRAVLANTRQQQQFANTPEDWIG